MMLLDLSPKNKIQHFDVPSSIKDLGIDFVWTNGRFDYFTLADVIVRKCFFLEDSLISTKVYSSNYVVNRIVW